MLDRLIENVKIASGQAARQIFLVGAVAFSLLVTTAFLCAAAFVFVLERHGPVQACLMGAATFFVVTLISAASYFALKGGSNTRIVESAKKPASAGFTPDPMMLAAGLQVARAIGFKRLVPILAVAGLALGIFAARNQSAETEDDAEET